MSAAQHRADACTPSLLQAAIAAAEAMAEQAKSLAEAILHEPRPQGIVLPPMGHDRRFSERATYNGDARHCEFSDDAGNDLAMIKEYERPDGTRGLYWHPAHWSVHEVRRDARGNAWRACLGTHVMDDFGELVEVAE